MGIYRGAGGTGDATNDASSEASVVVVAKDAAIAAQVAAQAAQAGAVTANASAVTAASNAATSATNSAASATTALGAISSTQAAAAQASDASTAASTSASNASTSATNAASSASSASSSASSASSSATTASSAATSASSSATTASTAATNAAASYDSFDDRYLGAKSSAPTVDNDGNALLTGALYFNTVSNAMKVWTGSLWSDAYASLSGAVTSVTASSPVTSSGGTSPNIALPAATTSVSGYLTSTDWNTFNSKGTGTVTSVGGTGTVNGLTLTGAVTSSGNLTLGGTLSLSSPPAIGNTTPSTGAFTTATASTSITTPTVQATNSAGLALKNSGGTTQMSMGAGGGDNLAINVSTNLNGTNAQIDISPTGTGHVHINPTGVNSIQISPTYVGTMDNMTIGATTAAAAKVTTLNIQSGLTLATLAGSSGQVLTSAGTGAVPTWTTPAGMTYPSAGIANSTGSAWGTSYTTSGTGTVVALATTPSITNPTVTNYVETLYAPSAGSSFTVDLANGTVQKLSLNANGTITLPSSVAGKSFVIIVTYSGAYTVTWAGGSTIKWPGGTVPTASSSNGKFDIFTFFQDGTNTYGNSFGLNY